MGDLGTIGHNFSKFVLYFKVREQPQTLNILTVLLYDEVVEVSEAVFGMFQRSFWRFEARF